MIIGAPRFAGSGQITPSKKGEILVPLFGSNVARWMCIWINFLFDNGLMKRLNRRSAGLSRLVSLNEKGKGLEEMFNVDGDVCNLSTSV